MHNGRSRAVLEALEVDLNCIGEIHEVLFDAHEAQEVSINEIMETFLSYRGNQPTTVKHMVDGLCFTRHCLLKSVYEKIDELGEQMQRTTQQLVATLLAEKRAPRPFLGRCFD